jgi:hypothetical protein
MRFEVGDPVRYYDPFMVEGFIGKVIGFTLDPNFVSIEDEEGRTETVHKKFVNRVVVDEEDS